LTPSGSSIWRTSTRPKVLTGRYADCGVDGPADVARPLRFFLPPAPTAQLPSSNALPFSTRPLPRLRPAHPISLATHPPATSDHFSSGPPRLVDHTSAIDERADYRPADPPARPWRLSRASCSGGAARPPKEPDDQPDTRPGARARTPACPTLASPARTATSVASDGSRCAHCPYPPAAAPAPRQRQDSKQLTCPPAVRPRPPRLPALRQVRRRVPRLP